MFPQISIVVPIYKTEKFLNRCVESLVQQTLRDIEIVLVDDGSPDNCPQMCDKWAVQDSRITVIHKQNGGVQTAIIAGVQAAKAKHIGFVDSDDWVAPVMFENLNKAMIRHQADCVRCGIRFVNCSGQDMLMQSDTEIICNADEIEQAILTPFWEEYMDHFQFWSNSRCDKLYQKELLLKILSTLHPKLAMGEDVEMNLRYLPLCNKIVTLKGCADYYYYANPTSMTRGFSDKLLSSNELFLEVLRTVAQEQKREGKALEKFSDRLYFMAMHQVFTADGATLAQRSEAICEILSRMKNRDIIMQTVDKSNFAVYRGMQLIKKSRVKTAVYVYAALVQAMRKVKWILKLRIRT